MGKGWRRGFCVVTKGLGVRVDNLEAVYEGKVSTGLVRYGILEEVLQSGIVGVVNVISIIVEEIYFQDVKDNRIIVGIVDYWERGNIFKVIKTAVVLEIVFQDIREMRQISLWTLWDGTGTKEDVLRSVKTNWDSRITSIIRVVKTKNFWGAGLFIYKKGLLSIFIDVVQTWQIRKNGVGTNIMTQTGFLTLIVPSFVLTNIQILCQAYFSQERDIVDTSNVEASV